MFALMKFMSLLVVATAIRFANIDRLLEHVENSTKIMEEDQVQMKSLYVSTDDEEINYEKIIIKDGQRKIYCYKRYILTKKKTIITFSFQI